MNEREILLELNEREYEALQSSLNKTGKTIQGEMTRLLERLYLDNVSEQERKEVERLVKKDEQEELKAAKQFAVVHLHDESDDYYYISEQRENFFTIAQAYYEDHSEINRGLLTLDTVGRYLSAHYEIDESVFYSLAKACKTDDRISAVIQFDFENGNVNVLEQGKGKWHRYDKDTLIDAVEEVKRSPRKNHEEQLEIFYENLYGEEIEDITDTEELGLDEGQGLTQ